jgi:hypothetical protein
MTTDKTIEQLKAEVEIRRNNELYWLQLDRQKHNLIRQKNYEDAMFVRQQAERNLADALKVKEEQ